ncbi:MAK10-like protein [Tanacetum coccineum]
MGDENPIRTLGDYSKPSHEGYRNTIELPARNNVVPLRSDTIRLVQNGCSFHGLRSENPNQYLKDFLKLVDSLDLYGETRERMCLRLFQVSLHDQASNWLERLLAGSISTWEDLTTRFIAQFFPQGRTVKLRNNILIRTIDQSTGGKLRDLKAKESWALLEDFALYDNESWNDPRDFAKPVKPIALPQDVNKITTPYEICSGPHDTQYCMENPEQAFVKYASSRTDEAGEDIRDQLNAEAEAVQIILTGIDNDIYSTVDAYLETNLYWEFGKFTSWDGESLESYYSRFYKMMNELVRNQCHVTNHQVNVQFLLQLQPEWQSQCDRAERRRRTTNPLVLVAQQQPVYHHQNHPTQNTQYSSTRSQQSTRNRGKAIVTSSAPTYDLEPATVTEDEEMSKEKEIDKLMALIFFRSKSTNLPTTTFELHQTPVELIKIILQESTKELVLQLQGIWACIKGMSKTKRVGMQLYHKEKMLLCKQEEAGVQLNAEQADWKDDTDDESEEQDGKHCIGKWHRELCAHQETISIMSQAKEAQIKLYKTREDKELDKVIALENKVKVLNDIVYKTGQSVQTMNMLNRNCKMSFAKPEFLKKAQRANPRLSYALSWKPCQGDSLNLPDHRAQVDQGSQIKMIQVKEMMQDNDLKNSKSKDKGSKSRSQSMNEQSRYKQDKTITRQSINVKRHIFNVIGGSKEFEERDLNIGGDFPHHGINLWLQVQIFYDHVNPVTRQTIDQLVGGKLRDLNAEESWALLEDLALYDNKSWNDPRDFAKLVKAIALPQDIQSTSDYRLNKLENQVQRLMEAYLAPTQPTLVNKVTTPCEICSGPHDTQYCMEDLEQAFIEYASSRTNKAGEGQVFEFMASQNARLSKFESDFKRQQVEMTNKIDTMLKAITDRIAGTPPSNAVKNPKLGTTLVLSACSYPTIDPQCSSHPSNSINAIKAHFKEPTTSQTSLRQPEIENKPSQPEPDL